MYLLTITIKPIVSSFESINNPSQFTADLEVSMQGPHGFLSATNWPLLHVIYLNCIAYNIHIYNVLI